MSAKKLKTCSKLVKSIVFLTWIWILEFCLSKEMKKQEIDLQEICWTKHQIPGHALCHGFLDSSCFVSQRSCRREPQVYFLLWMSLRNLYYVSRLFSWRGSLDCMSCYSSSSYLLAPSVVASSYCKYKGCPSSTVSVSVVSVMHDLIIIIICSQSILNNFRVQWLKEENSPHLALLFFVPFWGSRSQVISKPSLFKQHWFRES